MTKYSTFITFVLLTFAGLASASEQDILGNWINQAGDGLIEISVQDSKYIGTIVGGADEEAERTDSNNPDPELRDRSLLGAIILGDFIYSDNNKWSDGWIYDPNNGKIYKCKMKLIDSKTLEIRGYIGISLFGRTEIWKKES